MNDKYIIITVSYACRRSAAQPTLSQLGLWRLVSLCYVTLGLVFSERFPTHSSDLPKYSMT